MPRTGNSKGKNKPIGGDLPGEIRSSSGMNSAAATPTPASEARNNKKLDYSRVSVACSRCRRRKMRCEPMGDDPADPCKKCIDSRKQCVYEPVDHAAPASVSSTQRSQPGSADGRTNGDAYGTTFNQSDVFSRGPETLSSPGHFHQPMEAYTAPQVFSSYSGTPSTLPLPSQQISMTRQRPQYGDPTPEPQYGRNFAIQGDVYGNSYDPGYARPGHYLAHSSYSVESLPQAAYVTSTTGWREPHIPLITQSGYGESQLMYQPPTEYNLLGVPRGSNTVPYPSPSTLPSSDHSSSSHSTSNGYPGSTSAARGAIDPHENPSGISRTSRLGPQIPDHILQRPQYQ